MFVGHIAVAFAGKRVAPAPSLVWFMVAANLVDLIWPLFLLLGLETTRIDPGNTAFTPLAFEHYPWTHSLVMGLVWGAAFAGFARWRGVAVRDAWVIGLLVPSHWVLDFIMHRPDLPLWPGGSGYGLGLWNSIAGTFAVEGLLWVAAIAFYLGGRRPRGMHGVLALGSFVVANTLLWLGSPSAPPPPDERALALFGLIGWIVVPWAWWIERTSRPR